MSGRLQQPSALSVSAETPDAELFPPLFEEGLIPT